MQIASVKLFMKITLLMKIMITPFFFFLPWDQICNQTEERLR